MGESKRVARQPDAHARAYKHDCRSFLSAERIDEIKKLAASPNIIAKLSDALGAF